MIFEGIIPKLRDINIEIALGLDVQTLGNLCQVNRWYSNLCRNEDFWKEKFRRDLVPKLLPLVNTNEQQQIFTEITKSKVGLHNKPISWRNVYRLTYSGVAKIKPVYFNGDITGYVWVYINHHRRDLFMSIIDMTKRVEDDLVIMYRDRYDQWDTTYYTDVKDPHFGSNDIASDVWNTSMFIVSGADNNSIWQSIRFAK